MYRTLLLGSILCVFCCGLYRGWNHARTAVACVWRFGHM